MDALSRWSRDHLTAAPAGASGGDRHCTSTRILDLGTGSGCILIAALARLGPECTGAHAPAVARACVSCRGRKLLALVCRVPLRSGVSSASSHARPGSGCGVDVDPEALDMAEHNASAILGQSAVPSRVAFLEVDFAGLASEDTRRRLHQEGCALGQRLR